MHFPKIPGGFLEPVVCDFFQSLDQCSPSVKLPACFEDLGHLLWSQQLYLCRTISMGAKSHILSLYRMLLGSFTFLKRFDLKLRVSTISQHGIKIEYFPPRRLVVFPTDRKQNLSKQSIKKPKMLGNIKTKKRRAADFQYLSQSYVELTVGS